MGYIVCLAVGLVLGFIGSIVVACLVVSNVADEEAERYNDEYFLQ
jgi:hypothetical protein